MDISSAIAGAVSLGAAQGLAFSKLLPRHSVVLALATSGTLPVDSIAPPTIRSDPCRAAPRSLTRRVRRTRRRSLTDSDGEDGFSGDGNGDDGPFGGGGGGEGSGGGGGGGGWNYDRFGDADWEDPGGSARPSSSSDPAFDVVYEVLSWVALSNCAHFAYKKIGRFLTDREKAVPVRLVQSIC